MQGDMRKGEQSQGGREQGGRVGEGSWAYSLSFGFTSLFGESAVTIKFHQLLHFPRWVDQFGYLPTCWTLERKHKVPKKWITNLLNTSARFDRSAFRDVTASHLSKTGDDSLSAVPGLVPPVKGPSPEVLQLLAESFGKMEFRAAGAARVSLSTTVATGDVVVGVAKGSGSPFAGKVVGHFDVNGDAVVSLLEQWTVRKATSDSTAWDTRGGLCLVFSDDIVTTLVYSEGEGSAVTLASPRQRSSAASA